MLVRDFRKIRKFIKKFFKENDDGFVPNWCNDEQKKYFIKFNTNVLNESNGFRFETDFSLNSILIGVIYMSKENADKLVEILNTEDKL